MKRYSLLVVDRGHVDARAEQELALDEAAHISRVFNGIMADRQCCMVVIDQPTCDAIFKAKLRSRSPERLFAEPGADSYPDLPTPKYRRHTKPQAAKPKRKAEPVGASSNGRE